MKITAENKELIYERYMEWCNIVADDLEDKTWFTAEELVYKVLEITEKVVERSSWKDDPSPVYIVK